MKVILHSFGHQKNDKLDVVKYLISVGANKEAQNNKGFTALKIAEGKVRDYLQTQL